MRHAQFPRNRNRFCFVGRPTCHVLRPALDDLVYGVGFLYMKHWKARCPPPEPSITDPIWPGDPFWRSRKYSRELRAKVAHEYHHSPEKPNLNQLASKHGVCYGALAMWCYAYPFGKWPMPDRNYSSPKCNHYVEHKARARDNYHQYLDELAEHATSADPTWFLMGDPLPSRSALAKTCVDSGKSKNISLPSVPVSFTLHLGEA